MDREDITWWKQQSSTKIGLLDGLPLLRGPALMPAQPFARRFAGFVRAFSATMGSR